MFAPFCIRPISLLFLKGLSRHTHRPANTYHVILIKTDRRQEKKTFHIEEAMFSKNKSLSALFDGELYLVCVISIFATFEIGGCLRS